MPRTPQLTDLQLIVLSHSANAEGGHVLPLPPAAAADRDRTLRDLRALLRRGLLAEVETTSPAAAWRENGDYRFGLVITERGSAALDLDEPGERGQAVQDSATVPALPDAAPRAVRSGSKIARVLALLRRPDGATLAELVESTGWQPHTTRAALTGLRKRGHVIEKGHRDEVTSYRAAGER